jgi:methylmalonyl-CoA/ethylmalonyl-CoA epimerase
MTEASRPPTRFGKVGQVAVVVRDLQASMEKYWTELGIGPWRVFTFAPPQVKQLTLRGQPADFAFRAAFASVGDIIWELIEPVRGESLYTEFLRERGEGLHHVGVYVPSLDLALATAKEAGYPVLQSGRGYGRDGDGGFAYLGTEGVASAIVEVIEIPRERLPPDFVYPAQ